MVRELASLDFALDQRLHFTQALEHSVVEIAAIDKGAHGGAIEVSVSFQGRDRARLHVGITLPFASVTRKIVLERGEARHQRAAVPERAQAQVDTQHRSVMGRRFQQSNHRLREARKELLVRNATRAIGFAMLGKQQHQVDVRREIQLAAAQLAHRQNDERLYCAVSRMRLAIAGDETTPRILHGHVDRRVREGGQVAQGFGELSPPGEISPGDSYHLVTTPTP